MPLLCSQWLRLCLCRQFIRLPSLKHLIAVIYLLYSLSVRRVSKQYLHRIRNSRQLLPLPQTLTEYRTLSHIRVLLLAESCSYLG